MTKIKEHEDNGLGWSWCKDSRTLTLYFESIDKDAGIKIVYSDCANKLSASEIETAIKAIQSKGIEGVEVEPLDKETFEKLGYA